MAGKLVKGSPEAKAFMASIRAKKKGGKGFFGNILKSVGNAAVDYIPAPGFVKDIAKKGVEYGVGKTGLGMKRKVKGSALGMP